MFNYFLFVSLICSLYAYEPSCTTCKIFLPNLKKPELGLCKMFQDKVYVNNEERLVKNLALHCHSNQTLCGSSGFLYESINIDNKLEQYEYLQSLCCGELIEENDLNELEEIERDLVDIFQKMRKNNTKRVYKTAKELIKIIKNK